MQQVFPLTMTFSGNKENEENDPNNNDNEKYDIFYSQNLTMDISGNSPNIVIENSNEIKNIIRRKVIL